MRLIAHRYPKWLMVAALGSLPNAHWVILTYPMNLAPSRVTFAYRTPSSESTARAFGAPVVLGKAIQPTHFMTPSITAYP